MAEQQNDTLDRAIALNAFKVLCPHEALRITDMPALMREVEELGEAGLDRFGILTAMLEKRGIANQTRSAFRFIATMQRRHAKASEELAKIGERTDENAPRYDMAMGGEIALNNAIAAAFEDAEMDLVSVLNMAGMDYRDAEALLSLNPNGNLRYEDNDERKEAYGELIGRGLALNISSHYPGDSYGIKLSFSGEIIWRLVMGVRQI